MTLFDGVYIHPESYGTVLVIGAWNFPLLLTLAPVLPAIAAGINISLDRFITLQWLCLVAFNLCLAPSGAQGVTLSVRPVRSAQSDIKVSQSSGSVRSFSGLSKVFLRGV